MKVVTAGAAYMDIDAYAGCIAYAELLRAQGEEAIAASSAPLNQSIPSIVRAWPAPFEAGHKPTSEDKFVLIDISNPYALDPIVRLEDVVLVIDHHLGFQDYWKDHPKTKADIEFIGSASTKVYEHWKEAGLLKKLPSVCAHLLVCGILDNTLNFKARIATERDRAAYQELSMRADLPGDWPARYFGECQKGIEANLALAVKNDLKTYSEVPELPDYMGQLVVWDASELLKDRTGEIATALEAVSPDWAINIVSLQEGRSYFMTHDPIVQAKLSPLLGLTFKNGLARANRLWLRKEIVQLIEEFRRHRQIPFSPASEVY